MMKIPDTKTEAVKMLGGTTKFAKAVGTTPQSISSWRENLTESAKRRVKLALMEMERVENEQKN